MHGSRPAIYSALLFAALLAAFLVVSPAHALTQKERKNILFLNSYHNGYSWSDTIFDGIKQTLEASGYSIVLQVEYMDSKKFRYEETVQPLLSLYRDKFRGKKFDVIIVSDNAAFDFILEYGEQLFPGVPAVFCGVNDFNPASVASRNITGVVESFDVAANLEFALRMHPAMRRMVVIGDQSVTGVAISTQIREALPAFRNRLTIEFWNDYSLDQMLNWVRNAGPDTFFYFIPMYRDIDGQFYSAQELLQLVRASTGAPLYSNWAFLLGSGITGGKLLSGEAHGSTAAKLAIEVLGGTQPPDIPVILSGEEQWKFDYTELKRLHISENLLPKGATIINAPNRFYELNKQVFWTIIVSLVILTVTLVMLVMNILEKRSVEQKIKDQLSFLRLLMDTIPIPIYSKDKYGRYKECNVAFERFFNVTREEILNRNEWQLQGMGLSQLHDSVDSALLREPGVAIYEQTITPPSGQLHNIILHKATNINARSEIAGLVGIIFDFTDRKKAEDSLRAAEEKYRSIFVNSPLGIFRLKPDGDLVDINPALAHMAGYATPEAMLESDSDIPRRLISDLTLTGEGETGEEVRTYEKAFSRKDGSTVIANISVRIIRDRLGNVDLLEGFAENVTKRKRAEKARRESERMLQLVLDNIPQLVSWKDKTLRYLGANKSFCAFFGLDGPGELAGKTNRDIMPYPPDAEELFAAEQRVVAENNAQYQTRLAITGPHGEMVWLETNRVPLHGDDGEVVGLLTAAEDITQRINLERQLLQSQKMEAIGTLAGGISHDFNNILTSIINSVELALMDIEEDSHTWTDMVRALRAAQRGSQLVKQILTFSRPSMEGFITTNINDVLSEALGIIKASMPRNIDIREHTEQVQAVTMADPTQIHQVVMNLCTNAFHSLRNYGGVLELSLDKTRLDEEDAKLINVTPGNYFVLSVADNGPGIAPEILDKIFDPFFTTKGKTEGTGLGLAVVHGIIKAHRGGILVHSRPFQRTAFEIYLPSMEDAQNPQEAGVSQPLHGAGRILFVEDDEDQLQTIPRVLENLGYTVQAAAHPADALAMLQHTPTAWDLLITDFDMPDINGLELAEEVLGVAPGLPVILVSGRDVASQGAGTIPNIRSVVSKPYNRNTLAEAIRKVLTRT
ncbi:PAS domain S-box protein [Desulfovibrio psychrotolerans]|uniref:histidine kinase n=1 Tax=Desulfovibrio psychrotolerans TaxID=415242 RepID=A0A7J0BTJ0_9BACT|nr:PAS domain S-box protein [Desulfovibrio psychrotolerans]GFM36314.1 hybrid sensor histidine kinase/response regulator [Desulfovibrio psychrotolerans]